MKGRKPVPISVVNPNDRKSKDEVESRLSNEPTGCTDSLVPPTKLSKEARKEWKRLVELYRQLDASIINDLDLGMLAAYCESRARFIEAQRKYNPDELIQWTEKGPVENPYMRIMDKEGQLIAKYGEQLALTPVGRARIGIAKAKKELENDPMAALLAGGRP